MDNVLNDAEMDAISGAVLGTETRVWEQTLINRYGLEKNGGLLLNKVNSITLKNWWQYGIK